MAGTWTELALADGSSAWKCTPCGLVIGGAPLEGRPGRCPVCSARSGSVVAVIAEPSRTAALSMLVLDRDFLNLLATYRAAKREHEAQSHARASVNDTGNYEMDGPTSSADIEASASREQRSALALADATERRLDTGRASTPSRAPTHARSSRPSLPH